MADKKSFFENINKNSSFDSEFYKKCYGYSVYDENFLVMVKQKFINIGRSEAINEYDVWFKRWEHDYNSKIKRVAYHYATVECPKQWEKLLKEYKKETGVKQWEQIDLLLKKKELLLKKKLLLLN